jgi:hypothetical protein
VLDGSPRGSGTLWLHDAGWSSLVARRAHNPKVAGSNPAPATNRCSRKWHRSVVGSPGFLAPTPGSRDFRLSEPGSRTSSPAGWMDRVVRPPNSVSSRSTPCLSGVPEADHVALPMKFWSKWSCTLIAIWSTLGFAHPAALSDGGHVSGLSALWAACRRDDNGQRLPGQSHGVR